MPPFFTYEKAEAIAAILKPLKADKTNIDFTFKWGAIADHLGYCAVTIASAAVEFSPPFLPITTLPYFENEDIRRVYLSATINYRSDLIRCCGREIPETNHIAPKNDAGEGERLVLFSKYLKEDEMAEETIPAVSKNRKVVVSVPSYQAAKRWSSLAPPPKVENQGAHQLPATDERGIHFSFPTRRHRSSGRSVSNNGDGWTSYRRDPAGAVPVANASYD